MKKTIGWFHALTCVWVAALTASAGGCGRGGVADPAAQADVVKKMRLVDTAAAGGPAAGGTGSGWGTLKGRFVFNGTPPASRTNPGFDAAKDPLCKIPVVDDSFVVDPSSKGIRNVLIYLTAAPRIHPDLEKGGAERLFDQKDCRFIEHVFAVNMKDKFVVLNGDNAAHNAKMEGTGGNEGFNVLLTAKSGRFDYPGFRKAMALPTEISCSIHPWMKAYVIARPDPYFAVTAADGTFTIDKLPAGTELKFQVWHERGAGDRNGLKAKPDWSSRGQFTLKIPNDGETVTLDVSVDPSAFQL